jgi:hypothetical protein
MPCSRAGIWRVVYVRKLIWAGVAALAASLIILGWILTNAGLFGRPGQEKLGPEKTYAPATARS